MDHDVGGVLVIGLMISGPSHFGHLFLCYSCAFLVT